MPSGDGGSGDGYSGDGGSADGPRAGGAPDLRPLTARSAVASVLLGMHPPQLPARILVASGELFGVAENATRTAISRMVAAGELEAVDGGYRLAGHLLDRQRRQDQSRAPEDRAWDGGWEMAVVVGHRRGPQARAALRRATAALHLGELREGVWLRPDNLDPDRQPAARATLDEQCRRFAASPVDDPVELASTLWDLGGWADGAQSLRSAMRDSLGDLERGRLDRLAPAFGVAARTVRHLLADPMLPGRLLPSQWPGPSLRSEYELYDRAFTRLWRSWYHTQVEPARAQGPLGGPT